MKSTLFGAVILWLANGSALLAILLVPVIHAAALTDNPPSVEKLIDQLQDTKESGYGYSPSLSGSQFLPRAGSAQMATALLGQSPPKASGPMTEIVRQGVKAIPDLIKHLDDSRPTQIPPVAGMMFTAWNDEYDYNRRTTKTAPKDVNRDSFRENHHPKDHQITVGDLCYVALGQIVNRHFSASRYQPSGGMVINSPTYSKALQAAIRNDYSEMTDAKLKAQLLEDFRKPDFEDRRNGAAMRLAFYYPDDLDNVVTAQLQVQTYDVFHVHKVVREQLYKEKTVAKRKALFDADVTEFGPAEKDGILVYLFGDLDSQIAAEEGRSSSPSDSKYGARTCLVELFSYPPTVKVSDRPYIDTWEGAQFARFINSLGSPTSKKITEEVYRIFSKIDSNDYLALACMRVLRGTGHDRELADYCRRRIKKSQYESEELRQMLNWIEKRSTNPPEPQ